MQGNIPPWIMRFVKQTGRGINKYHMIRENDTVMMGISGGKDSLALALALSLRLKWLPISYKLHALHIDWEEYPVPDEKLEKLNRFFDTIQVPLETVKTSMFPGSFKGSFNCYLCSRNRRRIFFEKAEERGLTKIALGHHLDDIVETTMINLFFRGRFESMQPVQDFFSGKLFIIRPMCEVKETVVTRLVRELDLPVVKPECPYHDTNIRSRVKPIVRQLAHIDRYSREHLYSALNFRTDTIDSLSKACKESSSAIEL
jgi:tRNA 2-thiocytidine biosynthesis protein TtcA